jgi:cytochrome c
MRTNRYLLAAGMMAMGLGSSAALADAAKDAQMLKLATGSGCMTCHSVEPGPGPDGVAPIGPAWREVAGKYKGDRAAKTNLTKTVMQGSNPYQSHWKGKVSGLAMPPNAVAITELDAKKLVRWILALDASK